MSEILANARPLKLQGYIGNSCLDCRL